MIIKSLGNGWYDFSQCPQEDRFLKVHGLNCGNDRAALIKARELFGDNEYTIERKRND